MWANNGFNSTLIRVRSQEYSCGEQSKKDLNVPEGRGFRFTLRKEERPDNKKRQAQGLPLHKKLFWRVRNGNMHSYESVYPKFNQCRTVALRRVNLQLDRL